VALQIHLAPGTELRRRRLNDLDIVVAEFTTVPEDLMQGFLVLHVHPEAAAGKIVVQLADPDTALRIDIFSPYGGMRSRSVGCESSLGATSLVSVEDLACRAVSILMGLARGEQVAQKHAEHFGLLAEAADPSQAELAWQDHRRPDDPASFHEAEQLVTGLISKHAALLVSPEYSRDPDAVCGKCRKVGRWRRSEPAAILSLLGYV
jgi:hypothetical protein